MASGNGSQTALQAWQTALFAQVDAAADSLSTREFQTLAHTVHARLTRREMAMLERAECSCLYYGHGLSETRVSVQNCLVHAE